MRTTLFSGKEKSVQAYRWVRMNARPSESICKALKVIKNSRGNSNVFRLKPG
jgi:hypothetical protein